MLIKAIIIRLFYLALGFFIHHAVQDYDLSSSNSAFVKWDSVYFMDIAKNGYRFEHELAFYPGLPVLIRALGLVPYAELVIPTLFYVLNTIVLYYLTLSVGYDKSFARRAVNVFIMSPATVFFTAPYTESPFCFFSFLGMLLWQKEMYLASSLSFFLASFFRSNGIVNAGFFLYNMIRLNYRAKRKASVLLFVVPIIPSVLFAVYANKRFCPGLEWCGSSPYAYVQKRYWNVGFMNSFRAENIPNILLALPIIVMSTNYVFRTKSLILLPYVVQFAFMIVTGVFFMHIQVITRFLLAGSPCSYWAIASSKSARAYCIAYSVIGTALFVNFLPWT